MKQILLMAFLMLSLQSAFAQTHDEPEPNIDSMLVNIDKSNFTSGILYERVFPWAHLDLFQNKESKTDTIVNIADTDYFEQALLELYQASNEQKLMSHKSLRKLYASEDLLDVVDVGVINASFHTLNYNPENDKLGGLRIVDGLFEENGSGEPAFLAKHAFIASPLKKYVKTKNGQPIVFRFNSNFMLQDTAGKNIVGLTANFGTSSEYVLMENGIIVKEQTEIVYANSGPKKLSFKATFSDGSSSTTGAAMLVTLTSYQGSSGLMEDGSVDADIPYQGLGEQNSFDGHIEYRIFYHNGATEKKLMKPIVIIDGFDPDDRRKI